MAADRFISATDGGAPHGAVSPGASEAPGTADSPNAYADDDLRADEALDAFTGQIAEVSPIEAGQLQAHDVTAILVAHNGSRWLPRTLDSLAALALSPDRIIAVDTGSRDDSPQLLTAALGAPAVVSAPRTSGYGAAVAVGVQAADDMSASSTYASYASWSGGERTEWIWLLHDDSAPAPDALQRLLETAVRRPDAGVIGPKVVSWRGDRQLLEVGLTVSGSGRRQTGLDRREYDQGQHDMPKEVLAVGSAGMLVRRDVWDELGGFDPVLSVFRDDIDFGWRANQADYGVVLSPEAVVYHAEAAAHGRRRLGATRQRVHLVDRRNALYVLLVNSPALWLPLLFLRILVGGLGRSLGFLLGKQPALAAEELFAVLAVLGRPDRLIRGRARRARVRRRSHVRMRALFPPRGQQLRNAGENVLALLTGSSSGHDVAGAGRRAATSAADDDEVPDSDDAFLLRLLLHPLVLIVVGLSLLSVVAARDLIGGGRLIGGALLPVVTEASGLWQSYTESWHGVGVGSPTPAPPYLAVIAVVAWGVQSAVLAVDLLMLASVPLAGVTAYFLLRRLVTGRWLRLWGSVAYGLLPATTGAIAAGRIGTVVAAILTPLLVLALRRTLGRPGEPGAFRAAWSAGLILAVIAAFVPLAWLLVLVVGGAGLATLYRDSESVTRLAVTLAVAPVVLVPWSVGVLRTPVLLVTEAGMPGPGLSDDALAPWAMLLQDPGGPSGAPLWLGAGLVVAGWAALLRTDRRLVVASAWVVAGVAFVAGIVVSRLGVTGPTLQTPVSGWPGYPAVVVGGALIVAAVVAGEGAREWLARSSFGWRQPFVAVVTAAALLVPVIGAGWWVFRGVADPLERRDPEVLPAYIADEAEQPERVRTLVLGREDDGRVTYALLRSSGPRLGDAESGPPPEEYGPLDDVVSDLVSGRGGADGAQLAEFAAKYIYLKAPFDPELAGTLDTVPGLVRASAPEGAAMWRIDQPVGRIWIEEPQSEEAEEAADLERELVVVPSDHIGASSAVPEGAQGRLLVLSELADGGWTASLDGEPLEPVVYDGWAQAFTLGSAGGQLELSHQGTRRAGVLLIQLGAVILATILALPGMRRERGAIDNVSEIDPDEPTSPELPVVSSEPERPSLVPAAPAEPAPAAPAEPAPVEPAPMAEQSTDGGRYRGRRAARQGEGKSSDSSGASSSSSSSDSSSASDSSSSSGSGRRRYRGRRAAGRRAAGRHSEERDADERGDEGAS